MADRNFKQILFAARKRVLEKEEEKYKKFMALRWGIIKERKREM